MATPAHCLHCFEVLSAALTGIDAPSLLEVEALWKRYNEDEHTSGSEVDPVATDLEGDEEDEDDGADEVTDDEAAVSRRVKDDRAHTLAQSLAQTRSGRQPEQRGGQLPISRLLNVPSPASNSTASTGNSSTHSLHSSESSGSTPITQPSRSTSATDLAEDDSSKLAPGPSPMFVTWNTVTRSGSKQLRGCIGTFDTLPLEKGLSTYATTSAFEDNRFSPISYRELPSLSCAVTLLTDFEPAPSPLAWTSGVHGLRLSFIEKGRKYGATYLPNVAPEQGWNKVETMISLMRKAGWNGRSSEWQRVSDLKVVRYQGKKISVDWQDWQDWRTWAEATGAL